MVSNYLIYIHAERRRVRYFDDILQRFCSCATGSKKSSEIYGEFSPGVEALYRRGYLIEKHMGSKSRSTRCGFAVTRDSRKRTAFDREIGFHDKKARKIRKDYQRYLEYRAC